MKKVYGRIISIIIIFIMVFSLVIPVTAATTAKTKEEAAAFLEQKGLLQGDGKGDLMLDKVLSREQMIVIVSRLLGKESEAIDYSLNDMTFKDVPESSDYAPYIAWAQDKEITQGYSSDRFGFGESLTAWQTKAFFLRALGYTSLEDKDISIKATQLGITAGSTAVEKSPIKRADMSLLMYNTLNAKTSDGKILSETIGVTTPTDQTAKLEITAQLVSDSTIKVKFNRAVLDTNKIVFELKGSSVVTTINSWNYDKTEANLTTYSPLLEGIYTVRATGDTFATGKDSVIVTVVKNGISKIEATSNKLYKASDHATSKKATFKYKVTDSFGVDVTKTTYKSDLMVFASKPLNNANGFDVDTETGTMTLYFASSLATTDTSVAITIISTKNNITTSIPLTITEASQVDTITFKTIEYPVTSPVTTKIIRGKSLAAFIPIEIKDQYGTIINNVDNINSDILFVKSDNGLTLTPEAYTDYLSVKGLRLKVDTTGILTEKTVNLTAISKISGKTAVLALDIKDSNKAERVTFGSQAQMVAANDVAETLVIPITAYDQNGVQLSSDEIVSNISSINVFGSGLLNGKIAISASGDNKGKLVNITNLPAAGNYVITVTTYKGNVVTFPLEIKEAGYERTIKVEIVPASNLLADAITKYNYSFYDQYGRKIKSPSFATDVTVEISDSSILKATINGVSTSVGNRTLSTKAGLVNVENSIAVTSVTNDGLGKVTARLYKDGSVISTVETSINVVKSVLSSFTFEIANVPNLPARVATGLVNGTDPYARPIIITAKDTNGNVYLLPNSRISTILTTDANLISLSSSAVNGATIKAQDNYFVVAAKDKSTAFSSNDPTTKIATIKAIVSVDNGPPKEVTKTITISKDDPKPTNIIFADSDLRAGYPYGLAAEAKTISEISGTVSTIISTPFYIYEVDQYGVYTKVNLINSPAALKVANIDKFNGSIIYAGNRLIFNSSQIKNNEVVYFMYLAANGQYGTFTIRAIDGTY